MNARGIVRVLKGTWHGGYGTCRCPSHADKAPSLKIRDDKNKRDGIDLHCFAGCSWEQVKSELQRQGLLDGGNPFPPSPQSRPRAAVVARDHPDDEQHRI